MCDLCKGCDRPSKAGSSSILGLRNPPSPTTESLQLPRGSPHLVTTSHSFIPFHNIFLLWDTLFFLCFPLLKRPLNFRKGIISPVYFANCCFISLWSAGHTVGIQ